MNRSVKPGREQRWRCERIRRKLYEAWKATGILDRLDPAFNLDADGGGFVQDRMIARGVDLLDWLTRRDAVLYGCGRRLTVGAGCAWRCASVCTRKAASARRLQRRA